MALDAVTRASAFRRSHNLDFKSLERTSASAAPAFSSGTRSLSRLDASACIRATWNSCLLSASRALERSDDAVVAALLASRS
jgi:hypothetical protein